MYSNNYLYIKYLTTVQYSSLKKNDLINVIQEYRNAYSLQNLSNFV